MTLNCKGTLIDINTPKVMGIINVTPDSFYDGGKLTSEKSILKLAEKMLKEGATFLDVGGYSSKPGAEAVLQEEELNRVLPSIQLILKNFPETIISVDTSRAVVAEKAIQAGAAMVNDISAGALDSNMFATIAQHQVPYIMMHMRGTPQTMNTLTHYDDLLKELIFYFSEKIAQTNQFGINDIIIDPGFGFAKTRKQNFELLKHLALFQSIETPILVGISRKSMIYKTLQSTPQEALNGTTALHSIALLKGANILRVHDVKEAKECITLLENFKN